MGKCELYCMWTTVSYNLNEFTTAARTLCSFLTLFISQLVTHDIPVPKPSLLYMLINETHSPCQTLMLLRTWRWVRPQKAQWCWSGGDLWLRSMSTSSCSWPLTATGPSLKFRTVSAPTCWGTWTLACCTPSPWLQSEGGKRACQSASRHQQVSHIPLILFHWCIVLGIAWRLSKTCCLFKDDEIYLLWKLDSASLSSFLKKDRFVWFVTLSYMPARMRTELSFLFLPKKKKDQYFFCVSVKVLNLVVCIKFNLRFPLLPCLLAREIFSFYTMCLQASKPSSGMNWTHCMLQLYILCESLFSNNMWIYSTS